MEPSFIPVAKPWYDDCESQALKRVIDSGWTTQGPEIQALEEDVCQTIGSRYASAVSSGTDALILALKANGIGPGSRVITVSHSFIASVNCILAVGALPILIDIEKNTPNLSVKELEKALELKPDAVLVVHQIGMPAALQKIFEIVPKNVPIVEDAACAFGSEIDLGQSRVHHQGHNGRFQKIGSCSRTTTCFSLHPRKLIAAGEGGIITTSSESHDRYIKQTRQHGMSRSAYERTKDQNYQTEGYDVFGLNSRLSDLLAAVAREQINKLPKMLEKRREFAISYQEAFSDLSSVQADEEPSYARTNWQSFSITLPSHDARNELMKTLHEKNIATRPGIMSSHLEKSLQGKYEVVGELIESENRSRCSLLLPLFHQMTREQHLRVIEEVRVWARKHQA